MSLKESKFTRVSFVLLYLVKHFLFDMTSFYYLSLYFNMINV